MTTVRYDSTTSAYSTTIFFFDLFLLKESKGM